MAITKRNLYLPSQNLSNLSINVDDNRLGNDQTEIAVNFGTTPATVTIKQGSVIEVNGNSYVIDTADEVFQMSNATDNYITFTDNPSAAFGSASSKGTFEAQKQGFYQTGNLIRTLRWYIDQDNEAFWAIDLKNQPRAHCAVKLELGAGYQEIAVGSGEVILQLNTEDYDNLNAFNTGTYTFTAPRAGFYSVQFSTVYSLLGDPNVRFRIKVNSSVMLSSIFKGIVTSGDPDLNDFSFGRSVYLNQGDTISIFAQKLTAGTLFVWGGSGNQRTVLSINELYL
jgi:hypothetical protein